MSSRSCETVSFQMLPARLAAAPHRRAALATHVDQPGVDEVADHPSPVVARRSRCAPPASRCATTATRANSPHAASSMCGSGATEPKSISSATIHPPGLSAAISRRSASGGSGSHASKRRMWIKSNCSAGSSSASTSCARTSRFGCASSRSWVMSRSVASTLPARSCSQLAIDPPPAPDLEALPSGLDEVELRDRARVEQGLERPQPLALGGDRVLERVLGSCPANVPRAAGRQAERQIGGLRRCDLPGYGRPMTALRVALVAIAVLAVPATAQAGTATSNGTTITYQSADAGENVDVGVDGSGPFVTSDRVIVPGGACNFVDANRVGLSRQRVRRAAVRRRELGRWTPGDDRRDADRGRRPGRRPDRRHRQCRHACRQRRQRQPDRLIAATTRSTAAPARTSSTTAPATTSSPAGRRTTRGPPALAPTPSRPAPGRTRSATTPARPASRSPCVAAPTTVSPARATTSAPRPRTPPAAPAMT